MVNLWVIFMLHLKVHLRFFWGALRIAQKVEEKDTFDIVIDGLFDSVTEGADEGFMFNPSTMQTISRGSVG